MNELSKTMGDSAWPLVEWSFDGVAILASGSWTVAYANAALGDRLDRPAEQLLGVRLEELLNVDSQSVVREKLGQVWRGEVASADVATLVQVAGRDEEVVLRLCRIMAENEARVAAIFHFNTSPRADSGEKRDERRDPLTGLRDRQFLLSRLATLLSGEREADRQFAVLFVDLDNFKQVNDSHGHLVGDRVLSVVAGRLTDCVREGDHVVRYGGDEFVVLLAGVTDQNDVDPVINRIEMVFAKPVVIPDGEFSLSVSIGVAAAGPEHLTPEDILRDADRAMYAAKRIRS